MTTSQIELVRVSAESVRRTARLDERMTEEVEGERGEKGDVDQRYVWSRGLLTDSRTVLQTVCVSSYTKIATGSSV